MYEGLDGTATAVLPAQSPTLMPLTQCLQIPPMQSHSFPKDGASKGTCSSQESRQNTQSNAVRPKITITVPLDAQYDKLASKTAKTPVSPYERVCLELFCYKQSTLFKCTLFLVVQPVLSDDNSNSLPSDSSLSTSQYGFDLYVPDEVSWCVWIYVCVERKERN